VGEKQLGLKRGPSHTEEERGSNMYLSEVGDLFRKAVGDCKKQRVEGDGMSLKTQAKIKEIFTL